ncbi:MAG: SufS family cysteine desulfurase [Negativicoccus succinicivorans]|uniref:SufS family cysteine desulfurase n=1 Tax=Negativicoccus succinicivorans TaxID=620903 RepID=UPI0007976ECF|nr:SufS family cysteine desulfurase [Negativicoccus succinicivorans]KWZ76987.1 cysteine desulfurase, SufS subfamily [Anaerococcus hydrogenalis]MDU5915692.1 SufS family cysteine desulfurase [Negativicoccus succinicivorans]
MMNLENIRKDFPILQTKVGEEPLIYFDNAATTHRPRQVMEAVEEYVFSQHGNPHRGAHRLAQAASLAYDNAREVVARFINAASSDEIIFTRNATESLNLIARSYGETHLKTGDKIVITIAEHHANLVTWQRVARVTGATLEYIYLTEDGHFDPADFAKIDKTTKIVAFGHASNVLGMHVPVQEMIQRAHAVGAVVVLDGAQAAPHFAVDVQALDCDFYVFSGHKMLASQGIGVLYGKRALLADMEPFNLGGDMIEYVQEQTTTFNTLPFKFEAGTQNVEGAVSLAAAIKYLEAIGWDAIVAHEKKLTEMALTGLSEMPFVKIIGTTNPAEKHGVITFLVDGVHPHDVATILDHYGIAIRSGHHCAQPLGAYLYAPATNRASFYISNTEAEVARFLEVLPLVRKQMGFK